MMRMIAGAAWALSLTAVLALSGCYVPPDDGIADGGQEPGQEEPAAQEPRQAPEDEGGGWWSAPEDEAPEREGWGAEQRDEVASLAARAREAYDEQSYPRAADHLEEALDIDPERGVLWQNLAMVRYEQGRYRDAERLALRALDTGEREPDVLRESWWLIAAARKERGDDSGAREAAERARGLDQAGGVGVDGLR